MSTIRCPRSVAGFQDPLNGFLPHDPSHPFSTAPYARFTELRCDPWTAVGLPAGGMNLFNLRRQNSIRLPALASVVSLK